MGAGMLLERSGTVTEEVAEEVWKLLLTQQCPCLGPGGEEASEAWNPQNRGRRPPRYTEWEGLAQWHLASRGLQVHQLNEQTGDGI